MQASAGRPNLLSWRRHDGRRTSLAARSARENLSTSATITGMGRPFAEGAFRYVAMGHYASGPRNGQKCVAKWFKSGAVHEEWYFEMDIHAVEKAQEIIDRFNSEGVISNTIYLNRPEVWVFVPESSYAGQKHLVEPYIENFEKFNTNSGVEFGDGEGWSGLMQALSHYSYHITGGHYVLCDLQGGVLSGRKRKGAVLTDPVILWRDREFGVTDLGADGISTFFARHQCNGYCQDHWQLPRSKQVYFDANAGTTMMGFRDEGYSQLVDESRLGMMCAKFPETG